MPCFRSNLLCLAMMLFGLPCLQGAEPVRPLRYTGKTFEEWKDELQTELEPEARAKCVKAIIAFGQNGRAKEVAAIVLDLVGNYDPDDTDAKPIFEAAGQMWKLTSQVVPLLIDALCSSKPGAKSVARTLLIYGCHLRDDVVKAELPRLRQEARAAKDRLLLDDLLKLICRIASEAPETASLLLDLLGSTKPEIRSAVLRALPYRDDHGMLTAGVKIEAEKILPILIRLLEEDKNRDEALYCLLPYEAAAKKAVPIVCTQLRKSKLATSEEDLLVWLLIFIGHDAKEAMPVLEEAWKCHKNKGYALGSLENAMQMIDPEEADRFLRGAR